MGTWDQAEVRENAEGLQLSWLNNVKARLLFANGLTYLNHWSLCSQLLHCWKEIILK